MKIFTSRIAVVAVAVFVVSACDFEVTNPGPVQDPFLDDPSAVSAIVAGARMGNSRTLRLNAFYTAELAREFTQVGSSSVPRLPTISGRSSIDDPNGANAISTARWVAEDGVERIRGILEGDFASSADAAEALLWAGYANRQGGDYMCDAVIDGGEPQPSSVYYERAEEYFTEAIAVAGVAGETDMATAARAARAAVRVSLGQWEQAVADASQIPPDFVFQAPFFSDQQANYNRVAWANNESRTWSVWETFHEEYYLETGDERAAWDTDPNFPFGDTSIQGEQRPWYFGLKWLGDNGANKNISSGHEMLLIEAEAVLRQGHWEAAVDLINQVRTSYLSHDTGEALEGWEVDNLEDAWTALKTERLVELWLEGRRLPDLRRWIKDDTPGDQVDMEGRYLCYPISLAERETNPNVPMEPEFFHFQR